MTFSTTIAERTNTRNTIKDTEDKRILKPFDYNLITPVIRGLYADIWPSILASKTPCTIQVEYTPANHDAFVAFLRGYILANGYNRDSTESHVAELIGWMRDGFSPASTNFAIDAKGAVRNGGHSSKAVLRGYFPQSAYYGLRGKPVIIEDTHVSYDELEADDSGFYFAGDDGLAYESVLPPMPNDTVIVDGIEVPKYPEVGEFDDETGAFILGSDTPEVRKFYVDPNGVKRPLQLVINVSVFGPADALHRENTTLVPTAETYLNMSGCIKTHYAEQVPSFLHTKLGNLLTMIRKRTMHGSAGGFGTVGRGGRMNGEDAPAWYLAYMPQVLDSVALLVDTQGNQKPRPLFTPSKGDANNPAYKGGANLLQILTAMAVSDHAGRERIAKWVTSTGDEYKANKGLQKLVDLVRPPKAATTGTLPTDAVVELLVLVGLGKTDPVEVLNQDWQRPTGKDGALESASAWLIEENRASGWDRCDVDVLDDGEDTLSTSLIEYAKQLSGEDSRAAKSATRKAPKGKPKAAK